MKMNKISISLILALLICTLAIFGCSSDTSSSDSKDTTVNVTGTDLKSFSKEELAKFDGKNGNPAYIAVDGAVYDVTEVSQWKDGTHADKYEAGKDVTSEFNTQSPHSASIIDGVTIVGVYTG